MPRLKFAALAIIAVSGLPTVVLAQDFPTNRKLAEQNVALTVTGFKFGGGIVGQPKGNGLEIVRGRWFGSGFIVNRDGTLVTNYHVASRAEAIEANFDEMGSKGGATYQVPLIKVYDPKMDLAVLKIQGSGKFDPVRLGNSDQVEPRDDVLAVGNPQNIGLNITEGDVSQVKRDSRSRRPFSIVHTAPVTSGNSGGALYKGKDVIGVNVTVMLGPGRGQTGFHQAVPINFVKDLLDNPDFAKTVALTDVFKTDVETLNRKSRQVWAATHTAPPGRERDPGKASITLPFDSLSDYLIVLNWNRDVDMDVILRHGENIIGAGTSRQARQEVVAISNEYRRDEVQIVFLNWSTQPTKFGAKLSKIVW